MQKTTSFTKFARLLVTALVALFAVSSVSACAAVDPIDLKTVAAVIDVRTPAEFATGHLEGAVNIDVQGADFTTQIDALDHAANYVVYCHSGNRARAAIDYMTQSGFTGTLTNAGGLADAATATKLAIVN